MKSIRELWSTSTNALVDNHKLQKKEFFIIWIDNSASSKASMFFSFQMVQKIHKGQLSKAFCDLYPKKTLAT